MNRRDPTQEGPCHLSPAARTRRACSDRDASGDTRAASGPARANEPGRLEPRLKAHARRQPAARLVVSARGQLKSPGVTERDGQA